MKKKLVSKGWYLVIEGLFIPFFALAFFLSGISDFQFIFLLILGVLSLFVRFFFTTKEEEKEKINESKYVKSYEYYLCIGLCSILWLIALVSFFAIGGDDWASSLFPFIDHHIYIVTTFIRPLVL
jgi:hypothetical protein